MFYLICMILKWNLSLYSNFATAPAATSFTVCNYFTSLLAFLSSGSQQETWDFLGHQGKQEVTSIRQSCHPNLEELQLFSIGDMDNLILLV